MAFNVPLYGPRWFSGIDCAFEIISVITALSIWWCARKIRRLTGEKSCTTLGDAFLLIAISFFIKILTNIGTNLKLDALGNMFLFSQAVEVQTFLALGYFTYRLLFLVALIWLVCLNLKIMDWRVRALFVAFAAIGTLFSHYSYVVFHLISLILLIYVVAGSYGKYREMKTRRCAVIMLSFLAILVSQVMFLFVGIDPTMYVIGETVQLAGFLGLLYNQLTLPKATGV